MNYHEPTKISAIQSLCTELYPNEGVTIRGKEADLESLSCLKLGDNITPSFTWDDVETRLTELQTQWTAQEYARNRASAYPAITDQLDEIYHNGIDSWKAVIKVTKDKYPKG